MTTLQQELVQFTGTERYYKFSPLSKLVLTDGVKYLADKAGAYWLLDIIVSYQHQLRNEGFQDWVLTVKDGKGIVTCTDGNSKQLVKQQIDFTDFPLDGISLYCMDGVILLPSEY